VLNVLFCFKQMKKKADLKAQKERGAVETQRLAQENERLKMMAEDRVRRDEERIKIDVQQKLKLQQENAMAFEREKV
jgi:hypothetical protein